ncbi:hypothetical protein B0T18DRAFT_386868 [Schizothecium vesticola]|uniref:Uncharacterized protein n=1 Tax=Schizothecium vesticola TaxID=314040 RepID=A0AA40FC75_9PEZI|nr:hypothetical protein B0T18DRAFT_386868 [Schizothecium vesticola]
MELTRLLTFPLFTILPSFTCFFTLLDLSRPRALSVWKESPYNKNPYPHTPDDIDLQKTALAGFVSDDLNQRWAMIKDAHICYLLYRLYNRLAERALANILAADGNRGSRAKQVARLELVSAIHGNQLSDHDKKKYSEILRTRLI